MGLLGGGWRGWRRWGRGEGSGREGKGREGGGTDMI